MTGDHSGRSGGAGDPLVADAVGSAPRPFARLVCVSANAAVDRIVAVDRLVPGEIHRPALLTALPGGKALNVARAARHLGLPASVVAILAGRAGDWIAEELGRRAIACRHVGVAGESRTCLSVLDRSTGLLTEFYEPGVSLGSGDWDALERALADELGQDAGGSLAVIAGSLPPHAPDDGYRCLAALVASLGSLAAVDAGGSHLRRALEARPWLVKVNAAEAAAAAGIETGHERGAASAAQALRDAGAAIVLVTRGEDGAVLAAERGTWRIGPPPVRGPYTVGSGDAFLAGFASGLASGLDVAESARRGAAVAAAHALVPGQGELDPAVAERLLPRITIEVIP